MSSQTRRILIVDDQEMIRRALKALLGTRPDFVVVGEASDGRKALQVAHETNPDIAIIDYSLPKLSGLELTTALKREMPKVEILIYTMHHQDELILDIIRAGARGYVPKSDTERHLLAAIDALSLHRPYFSGYVSETVIEKYLQASIRSGDPDET